MLETAKSPVLFRSSFKKAIQYGERRWGNGRSVWNMEINLRGHHQSNRGTGFKTQKPNESTPGTDSHDFKSETRSRSQVEPRKDLESPTGKTSTLLGHTWNSTAVCSYHLIFILCDRCHWVPKRFQEASVKNSLGRMWGSWSKAMGESAESLAKQHSWMICHSE